MKFDELVKCIRNGDKVASHRQTWLPAYLAADDEQRETLIDALVQIGWTRQLVLDAVDALAKASAEEKKAINKEANALIADETIDTPTVLLELDDMLERCYYVRSCDGVAVIRDAGNLTLQSVAAFKNDYAGSKTHTTNERGQPVTLATTKLWLEHEDRQSIETAAFGIGRPRKLITPEGDAAINLWTPKIRKPSTASIDLFLAHLAYLIPVQAELIKFLQWLAHIEQCPTVIPHYGWLFFTEAFGIGRNWLASVLNRVWRGEVAVSLDLAALLNSNFNYRIAKKRLAVVDEIHLGESRAMHATSARLRQLMTEESRTINPKYGREFQEHSALRWILFSNHANALPIPATDRRFYVVANPTERNDAEYYRVLYKVLHDWEFINAIGKFFSEYDIRDFNPGEHPPLNEAKKGVVEATTPQLELDFNALFEQWKARGLSAFDYAEAEVALDVRNSNHLRMLMRKKGCISHGRVKQDGFRFSLWLLPWFEGSIDTALNEVALRRAADRSDFDRSF